MAAATVFVGCQKQEFAESEVSDVEFTASVEAFDTQTKTSLNAERRVVWSAGDHLAIFRGSNCASKYKVTDASSGQGSGVFKLVEPAGDDFYGGNEISCNVAFYPYSGELTLAGGQIEGQGSVYNLSGITLSQTQVYAENSFANGAFPMVAVTGSIGDRVLNFKNILSAMKLQFKGTQLVKSIKIEGANGEKLSGAATVTAYANNLAPVIKMAADASETITLDCGDGVQLNESAAIAFYIALPPVLFEKGFTVTVTDVEEKEYTVTATDANTVLRSSILVMPEITIESEDVENPEGGSGNGYDYVDEYGINHGPGVEIDGVVWAPVNCGYHATDYKWGKLYQWGRKYGQGYSDYEFSDATTPDVSEGRVSLQVGQSESNANVFYTSTDYPYDWLYSQNDALWNSGTEDSPVKTEYDPCPTGWRVPTEAELSELCSNRSSWTENDLGQSGYWFSGPSLYSSEVAQVFFPAAGSRNDSDADAYYRGDEGYYWSSRPGNFYDYGYFAYYLYFYSSSAYIDDYRRANGYSVRCVQDASAADVPEEEIIPVESVSLNPTSMKLYEGDSAQLEAKVRPVDATYDSIIWSSSDATVAAVDQTGLVSAISAGTAEISAQVGGLVATCIVEVKQKLEATDYYVDEYGINHGKGVAVGIAIWAPVNCGYHATDYKWGKLYQWGRKYGQGYSDYEFSDATTPDVSEGRVSLQVGQSESNANVFYTSTDYPYDWLYSQNDALWNSGTEDSPVKTEYDPCPTGWRVPTEAELSELCSNRSSWTENDLGQSGYCFSGPSSYSSEVAQVFFPAAGSRHYSSGDASYRGIYGGYWSSSPYYDYAYKLSFGSSGASVYEGDRAHGYSVRCVQD